VIIGIVGVLSCILAILFVAGYFLLRPTEVEAKTLVLFHAPLNGDEIEVGQVITIHATARDEDNITRIELWVDGELVEVETTSLADGISPFPLLASWQPTTSGEYTLTVRAFNSRGTRAHSSVTIEALEYPDRDEDGVTDELDACPDEAYPTRDGCPLSDDRDSDGVPDDEDDCPDEAGWADDEHAGCPTPGDSDGDGFLDEEDACPDDSGVPELEGCPDSDGDSVPDDLDEDPHEPGPPDSGGGLILMAIPSPMMKTWPPKIPAIQAEAALPSLTRPTVTAMALATMSTPARMNMANLKMAIALPRTPILRPRATTLFSMALAASSMILRLLSM